MKKIILFACVIALFTSCSVPKLAYFETEPYVKAYQTNFDENLTFVLSNDIKDTIIIDKDGEHPGVVTEFRKTISNSLDKCFKSSFKSIRYNNELSNNGIEIMIYRVRSYWVNKASYRHTYYSRFGGGSYTTNDIGCLIKYEAVVYKNGKKLTILSKEVISDNYATENYERPGTFKDAVKLLSEDIYVELTKLLEQK